MFERAINKRLSEVKKGKSDGLHVSNKTTITRLQNNTDAVLHDLEPKKTTGSNYMNNVNNVKKDVKLKNILTEADKMNFES